MFYLTYDVNQSVLDKHLAAKHVLLPQLIQNPAINTHTQFLSLFVSGFWGRLLKWVVDVVVV